MYNKDKSRLEFDIAFDDALDIFINQKEKYIVWGNPCDNFYKKCRWKNGVLEPFEKLVFISKNKHYRYDEGSKACIRKHYIIQNGKEKLIETVNSCDFPKFFKEDYSREQKYLKMD